MGLGARWPWKAWARGSGDEFLFVQPQLVQFAAQPIEVWEDNGFGDARCPQLALHRGMARSGMVMAERWTRIGG